MAKKLMRLLFTAIPLVLITVYACKKDQQPAMQNIPQTGSSLPKDSIKNDSTQYRFLALGDSYTIGESVTESERYPAKTTALLNVYGIHAKVEYIARTGWTTSNLQYAIDMQQPQGKYDIVTLMIGVNDQHQQQDTAGYKAKFTGLLNTAVRLAVNRKHVFVLSIPDYSVTPFANGSDTTFIRKQIDEFNTINRDVTNSYSISYIYVTDISRQALNDASLLAYDGLHPSGKMYAKWAALLEPSIRAVLK